MFHKILTNKIFISSFLFLAVVLTCLFFGLNFIKNKVSDTAFLKDFLYKNYGLNLSVDEINAYYSGFSFAVKTPSLSVDDSNHAPLISVEDVFVKIDVLPFIFKKASIKEFEAGNISLNLVRNADGSFNFSKYFVPKKNRFSLDLSSANISVADYNIEFNDLFVKNKFLLHGHYLFADGIDFNKKTTLKTEGCLTVSDAQTSKASPFLIDISFNKHKNKLELIRQEILLYSLDTSFLKKYLYNYDVLSTGAILDIYSTAFDSDTFKISFYIDKLNAAFNYKGEKNTLKADFPLISETVFSFSDSDLILKEGTFTGDKINISYSGTVKNILKLKNIVPALDIKISDTELNSLLQIAPDTVIPFQEPYVKNLKFYNAHAIVNGFGNVLFKNIDDFSVTGKLDFENVYVIEPPKNAKTSSGECEFKGRDVYIKVFANAPNDSTLAVFGKSRMQKMPYCEFHIKSFGKLDLAFAHKILMPVQKILALKLGPIPFMTLKGNGEIDLKTKGTKEKCSLEGLFETNDATVTLDGFNAVLNNGTVKVVFDDSDIIFNGAKGYINRAPVSIDGKSDTNGNLNIDVNVKDIAAKDALIIAETSPIVTSALDGGEFLKSFKPNKGKIDFHLNLSGNVPPDAVFGEQSDTVFAKGNILFKGVDLTLDPQIKGTDLKGVLNFENNADFDLTCDIFNSPFKITGSVEQKGAKNKVLHGVPSTLSIRFLSDDVMSHSVGEFISDNIMLFVPQNRMFANNLAQIFKTNEFKLKGDISATGLIYPDNTEIDLSGFDFSGNVSGVNYKGSDFSFKSGNITLKGKNVKFNKLRVLASGIDFLMDGGIDKFVSLKPFNNLKLTFYESPFVAYVNLFEKILPSKAKNSFKNFSNYTGSVSGKIKLYSDKIDGEFTPAGVSLFDNKTKNKITVLDGKIKLKNEKTYLSAFNTMYGTLPLFIDGFVQTDGDINPAFNIFVSTNLSEKACDELLNPYLKYPVLLTGEAMVKGRLQGRLNSYISYLAIVLNEGSDLSFMGLKLGDTDSKREISSKIKFGGNRADINYIRYFKYILSQNNKQSAYDLIKISGGLNLLNGDIMLDNLKVFTPNPAPVRFLNLLFKKSIIKDGLFTSDIVLNGSPLDINAVGKLSFSNVFVPVYGSFIDNIKIDLNKKTGKAQFKLSLFDTIGEFVIDFENKMSLPVVINNVSIHSDSVSINSLMKTFAIFADSAAGDAASSSANVPTTTVNPSDIEIKKGNLSVDKITFNDVQATNLKLNFSHSADTLLNIDDAYLGIAGGLIKGSGHYKFDNKDVLVKSDFINCDANELTKAFFNLSDQIYGNANGSFTLTMKDFTPNDYVQKINASAEFEILNGKLPKLGSIEYLLRASSLFKGGIFGLTINGVIELLKPYKHGDFNKISGNFDISDASIKNLKIYSQGNSLSTYTYGSYDILNRLAEIEVLGKLSKNVSNLLGPIGNASVVSVLNVVTRNKMDELVKSELMKNVAKIPFIDLNNDDYRLFNVKLKGEVTADDIVKSFNWLN